MEYMSDVTDDEYEDDYMGLPEKYPGSMSVYKSDAKGLVADDPSYDSDLGEQNR